MSLRSRLQIGVCLLAALLVAIGVVGAMHLSGGSRIALVGLVAVTVVLLLAVAALTQRAITAPLAKAVALANRVASGDLTVKIETDGQGEFGSLMLALKSMDENLTRMVSDIRA
ncbi:MAG TPA: HAMP domain-containing protein, partial [Burkholderiales bacterium]|nr:HAMP domain-containing protein [Burkholderiales bacterium]